MTVETTVETIEKKTEKFVACDGKKFDREYDCRQYEFNIKFSKVLEEIERSKELEGCPPFDGEENMENHGYYWFKPKTEEELLRIIDAVGGDEQLWFSENYIGKWICVEIADYDPDFLFISSLDDCISHAKRVCSALGYELELKEANSK